MKIRRVRFHIDSEVYSALSQPELAQINEDTTIVSQIARLCNSRRF